MAIATPPTFIYFALNYEQAKNSRLTFKFYQHEKVCSNYPEDSYFDVMYDLYDHEFNQYFDNTSIFR